MLWKCCENVMDIEFLLILRATYTFPLRSFNRNLWESRRLSKSLIVELNEGEKWRVHYGIHKGRLIKKSKWAPRSNFKRTEDKVGQIGEESYLGLKENYVETTVILESFNLIKRPGLPKGPIQNFNVPTLIFSV